MKYRNASGKICLFSFLCILSQLVHAQNIESPRFFHLNFQNFSPTQQVVSQQGDAHSSTDDEPGFFISSKLLFPISLKGNTKIVGQLSYARESIMGVYDKETKSDRYLHFNNMGLTVIAKHKFNRRTTYFSAWTAKTGSERFISLEAEALSFNTTHLIQRQPNRKTKVGLGFQVAYNQRFSVIPVIKYEKEFGTNWKADILLPSQILFFKKLDKNRQIYAGVKGSRASYLLNNTQPFGEADIFYRRLTANVLIGFERQLIGPLGFMIEAGANIPVRSGLFNLDNRWNQVHTYQENTNPYIKAGIFLAIDK